MFEQLFKEEEAYGRETQYKQYDWLSFYIQEILTSALIIDPWSICQKNVKGVSIQLYVSIYHMVQDHVQHILWCYYIFSVVKVGRCPSGSKQMIYIYLSPTTL